MFVQFTHTGNFETLETEIIQICFFNRFPFCFHLSELTFIKAFKAVFLWKTDLNFFKTINRSIPVDFRFAYLLIYKMKVLTEAMIWLILWNARLLTQANPLDIGGTQAIPHSTEAPAHPNRVS